MEDTSSKNSSVDVDLWRVNDWLHTIESDFTTGRVYRTGYVFKVMNELIEMKAGLKTRVKGNPNQFTGEIKCLAEMIDLWKMWMIVKEGTYNLQILRSIKSKLIETFNNLHHLTLSTPISLVMIHELNTEVDCLLRQHQSVSLTDDVEDYKLPLWELFFTHDLSPFICDPSPPLEEDDDPKMQKLFRAIEDEVAARGPPPKGKPMDVKVLCNDLALGHLRVHKGLDYEFVGYASHVIPVFSSQFGDGLHLNFFARPKGASSDSPPVLMFVEVANGDPQIIVRCAPVKHKYFLPGDEDRPITQTVYHPDDELCVSCEPSKYGPVSGIYQAAPPLI